MRAFNIQSLDTKAMETCRYRIDNLTNLFIAWLCSKHS